MLPSVFRYQKSDIGDQLAKTPKLLLLLALSFFVFQLSPLSKPTPACAACDPSTCCNCQNAWTDADNDGFTVGGAVSVCFDPGAPSGYRNAPSAQPDCNDSNPLIGYQPAQTCPTTCGYPGGTVPDGSCGFTTCPAIPAPPNFGQTCSACNSCGSCNTGTIGCDGACSVSAPAGGPLTTYYRDADGDGYGNPSVTTTSCSGTPPSGYVANASDCYDSSANVHPGQTAYFNVNRGDGSYDYDCDGGEYYASGPSGPGISVYKDISHSPYGCGGNCCFADPLCYLPDEYGHNFCQWCTEYSLSNHTLITTYTSYNCSWYTVNIRASACGGYGYTSASNVVTFYIPAFSPTCTGPTHTGYNTASGTSPLIYCH